MDTRSSMRRALIGALAAAALSLAPGCGDEPGARPEAEAHAWRLSDPFVQAVNRGVALMGRYQYGSAAEAFEEALELEPDSLEARIDCAIALFNRAGDGDFDRAQEFLGEVLEREPDSERALYFLSILHQQVGHPEAALPLLERLTGLRPHDGFAWYLLGRSQVHCDLPAKAAMERAAQEMPTLASAHYQLMKIAMQDGRRDDALEHKARFEQAREGPLPDALELPQYGMMGPLAEVMPLSAIPEPVLRGELSAGEPRILHRDVGGIEALADANGDGRLDILIAREAADGSRGLELLVSADGETWAESEVASDLGGVEDPWACAFGDFDNDEKVDLFVARHGPDHLLRGRGDGSFEDVTEATGTGGGEDWSHSAVFLDGDHDGDLDIFVCNLEYNYFWNNNGDGTFTDIAGGQAVGRPESSASAAFADLDQDRDLDLVVFNEVMWPIRFFLNERLGHYREASLIEEPPLGGSGGVLQDFDGDGRPDLLLLPVLSDPGRLYLAQGGHELVPSPQFDECAAALATHDEIQASRVADVDLDGDLDIAVFGSGAHLLLNDGRGRFKLLPDAYPAPHRAGTNSVEVVDLTGDGLPDVLRVGGPPDRLIELVPMQQEPPSSWMAITPTGSRGAEKSMRSSTSAYGTRVEVRAGLHGQVLIHSGLSGSLNQSLRPLIFGLDGAERADYLAFTWPDGVTQAEHELVANTHHRISETERRISSCPVLFAWNGQRFGFIGDFAGVGGLGYYVAPGECSQPQERELVGMGPDQLEARDGVFELRLCEPMEEVAYVDRLELQVIDHPEDLEVIPDERLAVTGPPPTHDLLVVGERSFPLSAEGPRGEVNGDALTKVDRVYPYHPALDTRFTGFCEPHTLELDFGALPESLTSAERAFLFVTCSIEYPYSQTIFAAGQASVGWEPMRVERPDGAGGWETVVPDAGTPGGMGRTVAIDLSGELRPGDCRLRITTNLEIYYDRVFLAADLGDEELRVRTAPLIGAELRRLGFPQEYSPDGEHPRIYTYDIIEPSSSLKTPRGDYTRYGPVEELLADFDDLYAILGTGDEIALRFDAASLPPLAEGWTRSFALVSNAWCKDMDLYTTTPDTVEPLPFRAMSRFPYPEGESRAWDAESRSWRERYNTRTVR